MNEQRIEKIAANIIAAAKVVVYDIPNGFASNAEWMYKWLRHEGLNPSWGDTLGGSMKIELPKDEVPALQELQKTNPSRFGNWHKYEASFRDDEDEVVVCSACGSEQLESECLLGGLGNRKHYRCRHCGITWSEVKASIAERIARSFFANKFQRGDIVYLQRNGKATKTKIIEKHFNGGKWAYTVEGEDKPVAEAELDFKA